MNDLEQMIGNAKTVLFRSESGAVVKFITVTASREPGPAPVRRWVIWIEGGTFLTRRASGEQAVFDTFEEAYRAAAATPHPAGQNRLFLVPPLKEESIRRAGSGYRFR